jgi:hypothetical protein
LANDDPFAAFQQPATNQSDPFAAFQQPAEASAPEPYRTPVGGFQALKDIAEPIGAGLQSFGGNILEDVGKLIKNNVMSQLSRSPQPTQNPYLAQLGKEAGGLSQVGQGLVSGANEKMANATFPQQLLAQGAQYLPYAATSLIPGLGEGMLGTVGSGVAGGILSGATQNQEDRAKNAILGGVFGALPGATKIIGSGLKFGAQALIPGIGTKFMEGISSNLPKDVLNKVNTENVINNYTNKLAQSSEKYNQLKTAAANIAVKPYQRTLNTLDSTLQRRGVDPDLSVTLQRYRDNPTFNNAHELQSALGKEAANFKSSLGKTPEDTITQRLLNNARGDINDRIEQTFKNSGNDDLLNQYKDATDYFKNHVLPYRQKSSIWRVINGKEYPADITKTLTKDDKGGYNDALRQHIADNPEQAKSLIAQSLHTAADPEGKLGFVPLKKLLANADNMPSSIKEMADKVGLSKQLENLAGVYKAKKALKWGGGAAIALGGLDKLRKIF